MAVEFGREVGSAAVGGKALGGTAVGGKAVAVSAAVVVGGSKIGVAETRAGKVVGMEVGNTNAGVLVGTFCPTGRLHPEMSNVLATRKSSFRL